MAVSDPRLQYVMQDVFQACPRKCFGKQHVDLCVADVSYFRKLSSCSTFRKDEHANSASNSVGGLRSKNPFLGNWAVLLQELSLGLSVLGQGGVMIFRFPGAQVCTYDWHTDACICFLTFVDSLFTSTAPFKPEDKVCYIVCRGFRRDASVAIAAAESLHKAALEIMQHGPVSQGVLNVKLFQKMRSTESIPSNTAWWIRDVYLTATKIPKTWGPRDECEDVPEGCAPRLGAPSFSAPEDGDHVEQKFWRRLFDAPLTKEQDEEGLPTPPPCDRSCDASTDDLASQQSESSPRASSSSSAAEQQARAMPLPLQLLGKRK